MRTNKRMQHEFKTELAALMVKHGIRSICATHDIDIEVAFEDDNYFRLGYITPDSLTSD